MPQKKSWLDKGIESIIKKDPVYADKIMMKNALPQKMSEVLLDFAKPLLDEIDPHNKKALNSAILTAVTVWNKIVHIERQTPSDSFADRLNRKSMMVMYRRAFKGDIGESVLAALQERKQSLYPDNKCRIVDFDINWDDPEYTYHLTVMSIS